MRMPTFELSALRHTLSTISISITSCHGLNREWLTSFRCDHVSISPRYRHRFLFLEIMESRNLSKKVILLRNFEVF